MFVIIVVALHLLAAGIAVYVSKKEKKADKKDFEEFLERLSEPPPTVPASPEAFRRNANKLFRTMITNRPSTIPSPPVDSQGKLLLFKKP